MASLLSNCLPHQDGSEETSTAVMQKTPIILSVFQSGWSKGLFCKWEGWEQLGKISPADQHLHPAVSSPAPAGPLGAHLPPPLWRSPIVLMKPREEGERAGRHNESANLRALPHHPGSPCATQGEKEGQRPTQPQIASRTGAWALPLQQPWTVSQLGGIWLGATHPHTEPHHILCLLLALACSCQERPNHALQSAC